MFERTESDVAAPTVESAGPAGPAGGHALLALQQAAGNAAVVAMLGAQAKLVVGAADDPYEREADRVAEQVMRRLATDDVTPDPEAALAVTRRRVQRHGGHDGGEVSPEVDKAIAQSRRNGRSLDAGTRSRMEGAFGTDFSGVRVHDGRDAGELSRSLGAHAFTLGSDIWFGQGKYQPSTTSGQELLAHELTHVAQQSPDDVARKVMGDGVIQRHASWEHRMLGDVRPEALSVIVGARDSARAAKEKEKAKAAKPKSGGAMGAPLLAEPADDGVELAVDGESEHIAEATHVLQTQIGVLQAMRADATLTNQNEATAKTRAKTGLTNAPEVTLVPVKLLDSTWDVVTYGEINTLADYYGNYEEIGKTVPGNFRAIVKGLRERQLRGWAQILAEVQNKTEKQIEAAKADDAHKFEGAIGDSGRQSGDMAELQLMGMIPGAGDKAKPALPDQPETGYSAGLARNACHFAPYSWHAWATHHNQAVDLAKKSFAKREEADNLFDPRGDQAAIKAQEDKLNAEADELLRQALLINGFGDHFLQDSYASGHLINKTLIMKWFTMYLDQHPLDQDFATDATWRGVQATAYGQSGVFGTELYDSAVSTPSTDPQSAENLKGSWQSRFDALGLTIPRSLQNPQAPAAQLLKSWQEEAATKGHKTRSLKELSTLSGYVDVALKDAVLDLVKDSVIYRETKHRTIVADERMAGDTSQVGKAQNLEHGDYHEKDTFTIRDTYIPKKPEPVKGAATPAAVPATQAIYDDKAKATAHDDYLTFLNRSYLQFSTNVLHNKFCQEGLSVKTAADGALFRVYGDNAMLDAGAAAGVEYSAETARRSIGAIKEWAATGKVAAKHTVDAIAARLPNQVEFDGKVSTIKNWHAEGGPLQKHCNTVVFPGIAKSKNFKSSVVGAGATVAPTVSKDKAVHSGADF